MKRELGVTNFFIINECKILIVSSNIDDKVLIFKVFEWVPLKRRQANKKWRKYNLYNN